MEEKSWDSLVPLTAGEHLHNGLISALHFFMHLICRRANTVELVRELFYLSISTSQLQSHSKFEKKSELFPHPNANPYLMFLQKTRSKDVRFLIRLREKRQCRLSLVTLQKTW